MVPRQGRGRCPVQKGTGELIRYHPVTPRTFAPPRGTTCTTCTTCTTGERERVNSGVYFKPLAAARRPTSSNTASDPPPLKFSNRRGQGLFSVVAYLAGLRVLSAVIRMGCRMLASEGGSAEVVHASPGRGMSRRDACGSGRPF